MAELWIQLRRNPLSGKQDIVVSLKSDEDALPHEHEEHHRALVNKILEKGIVSESELGQIVIEREQSQATPAAPSSQDTPQRQAQAAGQH